MTGNSKERRSCSRHLTGTQRKREDRNRRWARLFSRWLPLSWQGGTPIVSRLVESCRGLIWRDRRRRRALGFATGSQTIGRFEPLED
jgi:hypothetical protein